MMKQPKYVDLHMHTIYSDGAMRPKEVVSESASVGIEVMAIADHDITTGCAEAKKEADTWNVRVLTGVEVSTPDYHILGLDFEISNRGLQDLLSYSRDCQEEIVRRRAERLQESGVPITVGKVKSYFPESRIGKVNLATTLLKDPDCRGFYQGMDLRAVINNYLSDGTIGGNIEKPTEVTPKEAIDSIHGAGGYAIIAHPAKDVKIMKELDELVRLGIDGLEIQPNFIEDYGCFREYAIDHKLLITYGSDFHGPRISNRPILTRSYNQIERFWGE